MTRLLLPYLGLCLLITATPGLDTAVVVRNVLKGGARRGIWTAIGCAAGLLVHAVTVAVGLAGLLLHSAAAFEVVKLVGAAFLVVLGARSLWFALHAPRQDSDHILRVSTVIGTLGPRAPLLQGLLTNLTNPKATLFFLAALPQFLPSGRTAGAVSIALGLALIAVLFSFTGLSLIALAVGRARRWLDAPLLRRVQEGLLGVTLVGLGARVAVVHD
jgi:threonine/homoserine/homoserine lactone efflux protein